MEKEKQEKINYPRGILSRKGTPLASGARLPSVRTPRDLTLGGMKKRTFTPNLVSRKDKTSEVSVNKEAGSVPATPTKSKHAKHDRSHKNKGRGKNKTEFVQSQGGIFSEGAGVRSIKRESVSYASKSNSIPKPREGSGFKIKVKPDEEEYCLKNLTCDDFIDDPDSNSESDDLNPVFIPLKHEKVARKKIKEEPVDPNDKLFSEIEEKVKNIVLPNGPASEDFREISLTEIFTKSAEHDSNSYVFLTMPPVLPTFPSDDKLAKGNTVSSTPMELSHKAKGEKDEEAQENLALADLPEGFIGNLQITKSGKARLKLGGVNFIIEMGVQSNFLQDLVSIKVPEDGGHGDMTILGPVKTRLISIPELGSLL